MGDSYYIEIIRGDIITLVLGTHFNYMASICVILYFYVCSNNYNYVGWDMGSNFRQEHLDDYR